ncbi:MAG TPA: orotidine-5'-phosphate decarboxylase [Acidimicrobiales bacterium]|jgi:orotidine-5'-phosphate decarboxylase|nr:orotidine-5'-phosphate decarboxylase [Acidimicrobiales bacterium]
MSEPTSWPTAASDAPDPAALSDDPARARLAIALDVDDLVVAIRMARDLRPWFSVAKVGLELFSAVGPDAVTAMADLGYDVFADLKYHDIPTTVGRAARVTGALGAKYLNFHAQGGVDMLRAGVEGFKQGATDAGMPEPVALAVTILTSEPEAPADAMATRVGAAIEAGCDGVVCGAHDVAAVRQLAPAFVTMVPGIRPAGVDDHDQGRPGTPTEAIGAGASVIILGRAVTRAADPVAAATAVHAEVTAALTRA